VDAAGRRGGRMRAGIKKNAGSWLVIGVSFYLQPERWSGPVCGSILKNRF
jgi:hypothetical protein